MTETIPSTPLSAIDAVALDLETTGLDARTARVIQIGAVRMRGGEMDMGERFDALVNPGVPIPPATILVHGISDEMVRSAPPFSALRDALDTFLRTSVIIGHTTGYDLAILDREAQSAGKPLEPRRSLDVRILAELARPALAQYDLDRIAAVLDVPVEGRHTAIGDAITTARIFSALLPLLRERGIRTLAEAETACRALGERQASAARVPLIRQVAAGTTDRLPALGRIDSFAYTHRVAEVMSAPPVWCEPSATVGQVVAHLLARKISSVLVRDADGAIGLLTERDVLRAIDKSAGGGLDAPAARFISKPLLTIGEDDHVYRAIGRMNRLGIRHLGVVDAAGAVTGVVTTRNLLRHRASAAIVMGDAIDCAASEQELGRAWSQLPAVAGTLLGEEVDARKVASVISTEICALTRRAAELAEQRMVAAGKGAAPCPYAVLVLGSAGRGESLLAADQDNAIVYAEGESGGPADRWFDGLGTHMARILDEVGVPLCKGGVMAKNAAWRHSVTDWLSVIDGWVRRQRPEDILNVDIFFDGIPVHGDRSLAGQIFAHAYDRARQSVTFQKQLTETARSWRLPVTLLGALRTDASGRIDLKKHGLLPIFTAARVLAIRNGANLRGTPERLRTAVSQERKNGDEIEALITAHGAIMAAMLKQQVIDGEHGTPLSPRVDLKRLTKTQRVNLKNALGKISTAVDLVSEGRI